MPKTSNEEAYSIQYGMLTKSGAWPTEQTTLCYNLRAIPIPLIAVGLAITMLMEAYNDIKDFAKLSEILYVMITVTAYIIKHIGFFKQRKVFIHMMKLLKEPVFYSYPDDLNYLMVERVRISRLIANLYRFMVLACVTLMGLSPIFDKQPLPFPFPYELGRYRSLMFIFQVLGIGLVGWNNTCMDSLTACLMGIGATQFEILGYKLVRIRNSRNSGLEMSNKKDHSVDIDEMVVGKLKDCVQHHMAIIELVECVDRVFSFSILTQFLGTTIIVCNTLFHFVLIPIGSSKFYMLVLYLVIMFLQLFMYCWFGNEVVWKSQKVGEACYISDWYLCGDAVRKYLFITMERAKRPLKVTIFKFSVLSLRSFTTMMQWSYSYFALLLKLYKKQPK